MQTVNRKIKWTKWILSLSSTCGFSTLHSIALAYYLLHHYHYAAYHVIYNLKDAVRTSKYLLQGFIVATYKFFISHIPCDPNWLRKRD